MVAAQIDITYFARNFGMNFAAIWIAISPFFPELSGPSEFLSP
jgi:hypothetical protein